MNRSEMLNNFYCQLDALSAMNGFRRLSGCSSRSEWPKRGVYFFFEPGEERANSTALRVVRVGTHAVSSGSKTTLWNRLSTHRGSLSGTGNHRGSIFRRRVGESLLAKSNDVLKTWGIGANAPRDIRDGEVAHEKLVSVYIGDMPLLWLAIGDDASAKSERGYIERNAIALLSNYQKVAVDSPSKEWLGNFSATPTIRESGLWNTNHVDGTVDPQFLERFAGFVKAMERQK